MSTQNMLELTLAEILHVINPLRVDIEIRMRIIDELRAVVSSIDSFKGATVEPFGSFLSHLFSRWGDLDISVEIANGSHILVPVKKLKQTLLGDLQKALRKTGSFRRVQFVTHARVPILKLESRIQNISCDISINNLSGQMKSVFLLWISHIDCRFRDLVLLVKEWAKAKGINNPKCFTVFTCHLPFTGLLVYEWFDITTPQVIEFTCSPAILPRFEDLYPGNVADELSGVRADVERRVEEIAVRNIDRFRNQRRPNHISLSALFISFLGKFLDISTRSKDQGISTYRGRWEDISTNTKWLPKTYAIFIEDPFEQPVNTARAVSRSRMTRISEAFRSTYYLLVDPNQSRHSFIPSLVRQEISHFFPGAAFFTLAGFGVGLSPNPWLTRSVAHGTPSFPPSEHQFKKTREVQQKNLKVQNSKHASQSRQAPRVKPGRLYPNVDRQKTAQGSQEPVPPIPMQVDSSRNPNVKNGKQLSTGREAIVKAERQRQYVNRRISAQQRVEQGPPVRSQVVNLKSSKVENGKTVPLGGEAPRIKPRRQRPNADPRRTSRECQGQVPSNLSLVVKPKNLKVQSCIQFSVGRHVPRVKLGKTCQNMCRQNNARERQVQVPPVPSRGSRKTSKVQNGKKLSPAREVLSVGPGKTAQECHGQVSAVVSQVVNPPWPHTLKPRSNSNVNV